MEKVLDVYKQPYDPLYPVVCMDESPKQLIAENRIPLSAKPGQLARYDYEYIRKGTCNIFIATEPLMGKRMVQITSTRKKQDWAKFLEEIARKYKYAEQITLVMDNLNTHEPGSVYETFRPKKAKALLDRFEFVYTPKHGSWLNMAEIELRVLSNQCLNRRIDTVTEVRRQVHAWEQERNNKDSTINWRFTTEKARIKLIHLYPSIDA
jgi:transposase